MIGIEHLDRAPRVAEEWLDTLCGYLDWGPDRARAYHLLCATLHALRDTLPLSDSAALGASLPLMVRGFYFDGWRPSGGARAPGTRIEILADVHAWVPGMTTAEAELGVAAVFDLLSSRLPHDTVPGTDEGPASPGNPAGYRI